jgi:hypothetical protein
MIDYACLMLLAGQFYSCDEIRRLFYDPASVRQRKIGSDTFLLTGRIKGVRLPHRARNKAVNKA